MHLQISTLSESKGLGWLNAEPNINVCFGHTLMSLHEPTEVRSTVSICVKFVKHEYAMKAIPKAGNVIFGDFLEKRGQLW